MQSVLLVAIPAVLTAAGQILAALITRRGQATHGAAETGNTDGQVR